MSDPNSDVFFELLIAKWSDRFIAWLIDFIIISSIFAIIVTSIFGTFDVEWNENMIASEGTNFIPVSVLFIAYWIVLEHRTGQSIGKKILHLKIVNIDGKKIPESIQTVAALYYLKELSYKEIVEKTGTPLGTVKARLFRFREMTEENVSIKTKMASC